MKTIDADKILQIMRECPNLTVEELRHCIEQQARVVDPQKALVEIWNEMDALDPDDQDRLNAYQNAEQKIISSINPEYYSQFTLKKPKLTAGDRLYSMSNNEERIQGYTILGLNYADNNTVVYETHADGTGISEGCYEFSANSVDNNGYIYSSYQKALDAYNISKEEEEIEEP